MDFYKDIAKEYDLVMGSRDEVAFLLKLIPKSHPKADTILELACGTGTLLKPFAGNYEVSGLDVSKPMLDVCKKVIPDGKFYHQDMTKFKLAQKYDVILCLFNSLNHLGSFAEWKRTFIQSRKHLKAGGVFIFDINTPLSLQNFTNEPISVERTKEHTMITEFSGLDKHTLQMHISIFSKAKNGNYTLRESKIHEKSYPTTEVTRELKKSFKKISVIDTDRKQANKDSEVLYFVCHV